MAITSGNGSISDSAEGSFRQASLEKLVIGNPTILPNTMGATASFFGGGATGSNTFIDTIDKWPFAISGGTATDVGNLHFPSAFFASYSTETDGFTAACLNPITGNRDTISKFPFAISGGASAAGTGGTLTAENYETVPAQSSTDGFSSGGNNGLTTIEKFPFSISSGSATDVGDQSQFTKNAAGHSSDTEAFISGGRGPGFTYYDEIQKYPFSISNGTATVTGNLSTNPTGRMRQAEHSTTTDAIVSGGYNFSVRVNIIDKYPFSISSANASNIGSLTAIKEKLTGTTGAADAFVSAGTAPGGRQNVIEKFPISAPAVTSTDVGDLTASKDAGSGFQD